jgi:hypothetical protein
MILAAVSELPPASKPTSSFIERAGNISISAEILAEAKLSSPPNNKISL